MAKSKLKALSRSKAQASATKPAPDSAATTDPMNPPPLPRAQGPQCSDVGRRSFERDPADDCETPFEAYRHIAPFLEKLAIKLGKRKAELRIYDPYYCKGAMVRHLSKLGFTKVHNTNNDFYLQIQNGSTPEFDVLVTNPPYGADHIKKLIRFCNVSGKAFLLLLPEYVHRKEYYKTLIDTERMLYLWPDGRYVYPCTTGGRLANLNVCRHWERTGRCNFKGCKYLHPAADPQTTPHKQTSSPAEEGGGSVGKAAVSSQGSEEEAGLSQGHKDNKRKRKPETSAGPSSHGKVKRVQGRE
eukprot:CAMPEP_0197860816 /NCGR_PEP_ID=MMETSP1438-20131217/36443_1 /TAXON_ID=1461541 /ORGANISM="Pterosperma sp., Strain CCMP1384" /LENGTH=298 /DNA_ID=CAMNT_0043477801 /DNA_START=803 /DNA_END=1696 /DNA_ORIENTATION=-